MIRQTKIKDLKGVGEKTEKLFQSIGIYTVGDLINYYPREYMIYEKPSPINALEDEKVFTIAGHIRGKIQVGGNRNLQITTAYIADDTGMVRVVWFRMPYLRNSLQTADQIILRGKVKLQKNGSFVMEHPEMYNPAEKYLEKLDTMQPLYSLTKGLSNNMLIKVMRQSLNELDLSRETLPDFIRRKYHLCEYNYAIRQIHFPDNKESYIIARERLVFEEFLQFLLSVRSLKDGKGRQNNECPLFPKTEVDDFLSCLPYALTNAQKRVWEEIQKDIQSQYSMTRLIQGDVGSGKTIIAILAMMTAALNGYQAAMMAPTEVLARQHYEKICKLFEEFSINIKVEIVTGNMTAKEKRKAYDRIEIGLSKIIIGTHALIQDALNYDHLALVVTDEQHRFGVNQRETLANKGFYPHVLVMSATPIPRTLAIILYGDLDISVIDELPSNRLPIKNCVVDTTYRPTAYKFMKNEIAKGRQVYVICPMVEESEGMDAENVLDYSKKLQQELGANITVSYLHGKMKPALKDKIMQDFSERKIDVLVSTTVIEVGIDVPNATVMLVENAERFGLAQLHQIRGRVGRGKEQSYCIFMTSSKSKDAKMRLDILNKSNDGFKIASEDLKLRGPGDIFGIRQSGMLDFKIGDIYQDARILQNANDAAGELVSLYPDLLKRISEDDTLHIVM